MTNVSIRAARLGNKLKLRVDRGRILAPVTTRFATDLKRGAERDVREGVVRAVEAGVAVRVAPEPLQLLQLLGERAQVEEVVALRSALQLRVVDVRQQPASGNS